MNKHEAAKCIPGVTVVCNTTYRGKQAYGVFEEYLPPEPKTTRYGTGKTARIRWRPLTVKVYLPIVDDDGDEGIEEHTVPLRLGERAREDPAGRMIVVNYVESIEQMIEKILEAEQIERERAGARARAEERIRKALRLHELSAHSAVSVYSSDVLFLNKLAQILEEHAAITEQAGRLS